MKKFLVLIFIPMFFSVTAYASDVGMVRKLPPSFGPFGQKHVKVYDSVRGAAASYFISGRGRQATLSVYVYNMGYKNIPDGINSRIAIGLFEGALGDIKTIEKRGFYRNVYLKSKTKIKITRKRTVLYADLTLDKKVSMRSNEFRRTDSYLALTGMKNYIVKIRITAAKGSLSRARVKSVMRSVIKALDRMRDSSGAI